MLNTTQKVVEESFSSGIEFLVKMAEKGQIDPTEVDIIDITDKFLKAISSQNHENLKHSAKIIFHACVLLKLKAQAMLFQQLSHDATDSDDFVDFSEDPEYQPNPEKLQLNKAFLEKALVRKTQNKNIPSRKVTLEELILALKEAEKLEIKKSVRQPKMLIDLTDQPDLNDVDDILELAHDEDIQATIEKISQLIDNNLISQAYISFLELTQMLGNSIDWVDSFLGLLFLSNSGHVELEQAKFYDAITVKLHCTKE